MPKLYSARSVKGLVTISKLSLLLFFLTFFSVTAFAQNYTVSNTADGHATNQLRGAIEAADAAGGTHIITVNAGTYNLTLGEITFGNNAEDITINGAGAAT